MRVDQEQISQLGPLIEFRPVPESGRCELWSCAIDWARKQRAIAVQIVCREADLPALSRLGWDRTTEVLRMLRPVGPARTSTIDPEIETPLDLPDGAIELIRRTQIDSLDLPEALAVRSAESIFIDWRRWAPERRVVCVARSAAGPVGILLATQEESSFEIRYVGIDHRARRQGWGRRLLQSALQRMAGTPVLAFVDARNTPAINLYQLYGFEEQQRSSLIFRCL
jgi:GNAT superfamily N-acetyltransferase